MPYQTGTVTDFADLKSTILSYLAANGYTQEGADIIKKGNLFAAITATATQLKMIGAKDSDGVGNLVDDFRTVTDGYEKGSSLGCTISEQVQLTGSNLVTMVFPITYHFHLSSAPVDEFWCVIEYNGGYSQHIGFGNIVKAAPFTGGGFYTGTGNAYYADKAAWQYLNPQYTSANGTYTSQVRPFTPVNRSTASNHFPGSAVHAEIDGFHWFNSAADSSNDDQQTAADPYDYSSPSNVMPCNPYVKEFQRSQSPINGVASLIPLRLYGRTLNHNLMKIGTIHNYRMAVNYNITFGQVEDDGTDKWKFYPFIFKDSDRNTTETIDNPHPTSSGPWGFALRYDGP